MICKQLGYPGGVTKYHGFFGEGIGLILFQNVHCYGDESNIFECVYGSIEGRHCGHNNDVGVICTKNGNCYVAFFL